MNKADLKKKWSKYCDTDKLVEEMRRTLTDFGHRHSEHGVCVVLDKYFTAKAPLIDLFETSNHYAGDMRIVLKKEFDRDIDRYQIRNTCHKFPDAINAGKILLKYTDGDGKCITDYLTTGKTKLRVVDTVKDVNIKTNLEKLNNFYLNNGATRESNDTYVAFVSCIKSYFGNLASSTIVEDCVKCGVQLKKGMKTSRAFNQVCTHLGIDKANPKIETTVHNGQRVTKTVYPYDRLFAEYADLIAGGTRSLQFVISLNPLDYLTMSIGKSWTSCHSIISRDRSGYGGGACGGCVSYMLDNCSIITYVVDKVTDNLHREGKIYRQMYHYKDNILAQSRLYPQGNDGATDLYAKFRIFMCEEFGELLNLNENTWTTTDHEKIKNHTNHIGYHWNDIGAHSSCAFFYPKEKVNSLSGFKMVIGSKSYCFYCGREQDEGRGRLSHRNCTY